MTEYAPLPAGPYSVIYADPPWTYNDKANDGNRGASHKYQTLTLKQLEELPVIDIAAPDCLLAMWWVPPMPEMALHLMQAWGFKLRTMKGFTWHKVTQRAQNHFGMGHWTRGNTEDVLFATRGKPKRACAAVSQFVSSPVGAHSEKPKEVRRRLVELMGDVPRIELFARDAAEGWGRWGLEAPR